MNNKTDRNQTLAPEKTDEQGIFEELQDIVYRYVRMDTDSEIPSELVYHEAPEVKVGDVVELDAPDGKKEYYNVDHLVEGEIKTVYLVRARNNLWKSVLLLAILGISWYVIDLILKKVF